MTKKPKGKKFKNLTAVGSAIYYQKRVAGKRIRVSMNTSDWEIASEAARQYEAEHGLDRPGVVLVHSPTLKEFVVDYLAKDTGHLARTTARDRHSYLSEDGPLLRHFGDTRLHEITAGGLREWWEAEVEVERQGKRQPKRAAQTGRHYLNVLAAVLAYAEDREFLDPARNPVVAFRRQLQRRGRTKRGRTESAADRHIRPIERAKDVAKLVAEARAEGIEAHAYVLAHLDAGLRNGEVLALRWGAIVWGDDETPPHLRIEHSRPRGWKPEANEAEDAPKSGRSRKVQLSRRLRAALRGLYRLREQPPGTALLFAGIDPANFRKREWVRILDRAGIGHRAIKDLRDTYASQLLSAGIPLAYLSRQLGHSKQGVTEEHYAKWIPEGDEYRPPVELAPGEIPADVLARLDDAAPDEREPLDETDGLGESA